MTAQFIFQLLAFSLFLGQTSLAATFFVATSGSDSNAGTEAQPFRSINKAVGVLTAGDTLYIMAGTYPEAVLSSRIPTIAGTSWTNPITISAYPGHIVTMQPPSGLAAFWLYNPSIKYLIINGIVMDGQNAAYHGVKFENATNHIRVTNCEIKNTIESGILVTGAGSNFHEFINLRIHDTGDSHFDHGIYLETNNNLIEGCEIYNTSAWGVHLYSSRSGVRSDNNIVRSNYIHDNGVVTTSSFGIILSSGDGNSAYNNIVVGNDSGIQVEYNSPTNSKVFNNTVYANRGEGIRIGPWSTGTLVKNNIVYQNKEGILNTGSGTVQSNNLTSDPKFVNAAGGDFQLQLDSGAIDAGVTLSEVTLDHGKKPRPQGTSHDIGAFEHGQGQQSSAPKNLRIVSP